MIKLLRSLFKRRQAAISGAPHDVFPQILHWKEGDRIYSSGYLLERLYEGVTEDGFIYLRDSIYDDLSKYHVSRAKKRLYNKDLRTRALREELEGSSEYMDLITEFQKAYQELEQRDAATNLNR